MDGQTLILTCQCCGKLVDKIYQKGYCRSCLTEEFARLRPLYATLPGRNSDPEACTPLRGNPS